MVIVLRPALIFIGIVGWFMYSVDNKKPTWQKPLQNKGVTFLPIVLEEPH